MGSTVSAIEADHQVPTTTIRNLSESEKAELSISHPSQKSEDAASEPVYGSYCLDHGILPIFLSF